MDKDGIAGLGRILLREQASLGEVVARAWGAFGHAAALPSRVSPSVPILFFGNLHAYFSSRMRVLTVGLNPSLHEFPADSPFRRFPLTEDITVSEPDRYLDALAAYFRTDPYRGWFSAFEPLLNGEDWRRATTRGSPRRCSIPTSALPSPPTRHGAASPCGAEGSREGWRYALACPTEGAAAADCDAVCCVPPSVAHPVQGPEWVEGRTRV